MDGTVALRQRWRIGARQLAESIFQRIGREVVIEARERLTQPAFQYHIAVAWVAAFGSRFAGSNVWAMEHRVALGFEPSEGGIFDDGFGELITRWHLDYLNLAVVRRDSV